MAGREWEIKKFFSKDGDGRNFLITKKYGEGWRICGKYILKMKVGTGMEGKNLNGNKWEKIEEDKMGFGGQWMDEPPYRNPSNFKAFWRFW